MRRWSYGIGGTLVLAGVAVFFGVPFVERADDPRAAGESAVPAIPLAVPAGRDQPRVLREATYRVPILGTMPAGRESVYYSGTVSATVRLLVVAGGDLAVQTWADCSDVVARGLNTGSRYRLHVPWWVESAAVAGGLGEPGAFTLQAVLTDDLMLPVGVLTRTLEIERPVHPRLASPE